MKLLLAATLAVAASAQYLGGYGVATPYASYGGAYNGYNGYSRVATTLAAPAYSNYGYSNLGYSTAGAFAAPRAVAAPAYNYGYSPAYVQAPTQSCADRAVAPWAATGDPNNPNANYDGRTITYNIIPEKSTVRNAAENLAASTGFNQVARWVSNPHSIEIIGNEKVQYQVDWAGSRSQINGNVVPPNFSQTYHIYDCRTRTENVYGDFGGMFKFMGAP